MIRSQAAGKLFVAGEYAVVEPGNPSVLVAVDRFVSVELTPSVDQGRIHSDQYGRQPLVWRRDAGRIVLERQDRPADYVPVAIDTVERFAAERGTSLSFYELAITSELDDVNGRKFGLGSSAAVTVATVRAVAEYYGLDLTPLEVFKLSLLATIDVNPRASGGDIAASVFGGWIAYSAPDREALAARLRTESVAAIVGSDWPDLSVRRVSAPRSLRLVVGWTGEPASTSRYVSELSGRQWRQSAHYERFLDASGACVSGLIAALDADDAPGALRSIRTARGLLSELSTAASLNIETPELAALCRAAEAVGGAGKPSGAGGGDCGIALLPAEADLAPLLRRWEQEDIRHLALQVHPPEGEPE
ncbi:phosphomevalonate kinase [Sediminivirga luteola]|uniref:phosphomevalonate kinase n=1 Tax=Sediminivirga luteola TaxID=1774748 RepID=A0A8J2TV54_9MICO|nr:phosphomevalonate kinase [Sediminivirga luteola]GGA02372.1 phosphomevalonate kinase [Sediminivirga luteola]